MKTRPSDYLNTVQLLNQLVEEAAELASAASKMIRIIWMLRHLRLKERTEDEH